MLSIFSSLDLPGVRPRLGHHYRGHKMSIWLNLVPQLHTTGQNAIFPAHNSLTLEGPAWGVVRNASHVQATIHKGALSPPGGDNVAVGTTCMTFAESQQVLYQHNDTLVRLEEASKYAYSYALGITVGLALILCLLNAVLFACICRRRSRRKRKEESRAQTPLTSNSRTGSVDFFQTSSSSATPHHGGSHAHYHQQHQVVTDISGNVRSIPPSRGVTDEFSPAHSSSQSLPRNRTSGTRTLLVQPHHTCNGTAQRRRHDPPPVSPPIRAGSSLSAAPPSPRGVATVKSGRGRPAAGGGRDSLIESQLESFNLSDLGVTAVPPPPGDYDQDPASIEALLLHQQQQAAQIPGQSS